MTADYQTLANRIPAALPRLESLSCLLGFDGTVDVICKPVQTRDGPGDAFSPFPKIRDFGEHIVAADGKSALIEIVEEQEKIGGNGPIMANALAASGLPIDYVGTLGSPELHPAYRDFAKKVRARSIAPPAITHALEFENGKVMLTTMSTYEQVHPDRIRKAIGRDHLRELVTGSRLCCLQTWTVLPRMNEIFDWFLEDILPDLPNPEGGQERLFFFDLADPSMRHDDDLRDVLARIARFATHGIAVLGMNLNEAQQVSNALGIAVPSAEPDSLRTALESIHRKLGIQIVMAHPLNFAACATGDGSWVVPGPYTPKPVITTGAGDHLNAGFCLGLLLGFPPEDALKTGVLFSGYYVRHASPPGLDEIPAFIEQLQAKPDTGE